MPLSAPRHSRVRTWLAHESIVLHGQRRAGRQPRHALHAVRCASQPPISWAVLRSCPACEQRQHPDPAVLRLWYVLTRDCPSLRTERHHHKKQGSYARHATEPLAAAQSRASPHGPSRTALVVRVQEAQAISELVQSLLRDQVRAPAGQEALTAARIGVICMSRAQAICVRNLLRAASLHGVNVGTVDDFQGQEMRVTFISTVLTSPVRRRPDSVLSAGPLRGVAVRACSRMRVARSAAPQASVCCLLAERHPGSCCNVWCGDTLPCA